MNELAGTSRRAHSEASARRDARSLRQLPGARRVTWKSIVRHQCRSEALSYLASAGVIGARSSCSRGLRQAAWSRRSAATLYA